MEILITGVSSGIGWGLTKYYLSKGDTVYGISRRIPKDLIELPHFKHLSTDLSKIDNIDANLQQFIGNIPSLDIVILNAGVLGEIQDLKKQSIQKIKTVMDINVWSNKVLIDSLTASIANIKSIVAISSGASVNGNRGWGAYSLSKASLNKTTYNYLPTLNANASHGYNFGQQIDPFTNTFAKEKTLTKDYLIVLSEEQTAGRGRQGKTWYSPDSGNIYMSIKFKGKNINCSTNGTIAVKRTLTTFQNFNSIN